MKCIISCEHASNRVPRQYTHVFAGKEKVLASHHAYDPGAAAIARKLAGRVQASVYLGSVTRLLIDLNRSPSNRKSLYTQYSRMLEQNDRDLLLKKYYHPYRENIENAVGAIIGEGMPILHISLHSFAPVKKGKARKADIGLLYDPARKCEKDLCVLIVGILKEALVGIRVRRNYPYLGKTDGFTSYLRKKYSAKLYAGIEIEINQALLLKKDNKKKKMLNVLGEGVSKILQVNEFSQLAINDDNRRKPYAYK